MHLVTSSQAANSVPPAFGAAAFAKTKFFQDPRKLNINRLQHQPLKYTISLTLTQDKDIATIHI